MIPAGISTATLHLDAPVSFTGDPGRLHVVITPSVPLIWEPTGTPIANFIDTFALGNGVDLVMELPHTDQAGFQDGFGNSYSGWYYTAKVVYEKDGRRINFPPKDFQILLGQDEVDLALVPSGNAAPVPQVAPILPVTSVAGLNGRVTLADLGLDAVATLVPDPAYPGLYLMELRSRNTTADGGGADPAFNTILDGGTA